MEEPPPVFRCECPKCGKECAVGYSQSAAWWIANGNWKCPHCKVVSRRSEWKDKDDEKDKANQ